MSQLLGPPGRSERRRLQAGLAQRAARAARFLLGKLLVRRTGRRALAVRIVETEAYVGTGDPAAHAFRGRTRRTAPLWGRPGTVYVYLVYGMHHCLNLAVEREGRAGCVLVRAAEPLAAGGIAPGACRGPGRLARTLGIKTGDSGRYLFEPDTRLYLRDGPPPRRIGVSRRVGITRATGRLLRFFDADSSEVSRGPRPVKLE